VVLFVTIRVYPSRYSSGITEYSAHVYPIRIACPPMIGWYRVRGKIPGAQLRYRLSPFIMNRAVDVYRHVWLRPRFASAGLLCLVRQLLS